jgi:hypothetical protein
MPDDLTPDLDIAQADAIDEAAALASELISEYVEAALRAYLAEVEAPPEIVRAIVNLVVLSTEVAGHRVLTSLLANPDPLAGLDWLEVLRFSLYAARDDVTPDD